MAVLLIAGSAFVMMRNPSTPPSSTGNTNDDSFLPPPTLMEIDFDYTVKSISASEIIFTGENGDIIFPANFDFTFYNGGRGSKEVASQADLRVGQKINLDVVPGRSATVYILNTTQ